MLLHVYRACTGYGDHISNNQKSGCLCVMRGIAIVFLYFSLFFFIFLRLFLFSFSPLFVRVILYSFPSHHPQYVPYHFGMLPAHMYMIHIHVLMPFVCFFFFVHLFFCRNMYIPLFCLPSMSLALHLSIISSLLPQQQQQQQHQQPQFCSHIIRNIS